VCTCVCIYGLSCGAGKGCCPSSPTPSPPPTPLSFSSPSAFPLSVSLAPLQSHPTLTPSLSVSTARCHPRTRFDSSANTVRGKEGGPSLGGDPALGWVPGHRKTCRRSPPPCRCGCVRTSPPSSSSARRLSCHSCGECMLSCHNTRPDAARPIAARARPCGGPACARGSHTHIGMYSHRSAPRARPLGGRWTAAPTRSLICSCF
jgi:hypothetical protein